MFTYKKKMEVNSHDVIDIVRLLGHFGLRFEISDEYCKVDDLDPNRKERFRRFVIIGSRKRVGEFIAARNIIINYHRH